MMIMFRITSFVKDSKEATSLINLLLPFLLYHGDQYKVGVATGCGHL